MALESSTNLSTTDSWQTYVNASGKYSHTTHDQTYILCSAQVHVVNSIRWRSFAILFTKIIQRIGSKKSISSFILIVSHYLLKTTGRQLFNY